MKTYDVTKLPTWAQQKIALLERNLADTNRKLNETGRILEYSEPGVGYPTGMERRSIPSDTITFVNKKMHLFHVQLQADGKLDINVSGYKGDCFILPGASNAFKVSCT